MKKIVMLVSGRGSNMVAIAQALAQQSWPAQIVAVIASRADAPAVASATRMGLPVQVLDARGIPDRSRYDQALLTLVEQQAPDLVVLAGYMRILADEFVDRFAGRLVNIHPSLLPAFPGLHPHRQALQAGVKVHGATVHMVTRELDSGPIIAQAVVPVRADDDEQSLAQRVLQAEHRIYPVAVRWLIEDRLIFSGQGAWLDEGSGALQALIGSEFTGHDDI
jgi:phosphoribosylglycinamide formyltransferase-1